jgi:probable phosphoglycerate mutase
VAIRDGGPTTVYARRVADNEAPAIARRVRFTPMSLYLIRHGETALNAARVLQPADTSLGPLGLRQAEAIARRIAGLGIAAIVSSDLRRALQTAEAIAAATGLPVAADVLLQERNFGTLRGLPYDTLGFDPLAMTEAPAGGESMSAFAHRIAQAFARLLALHARAGGPLAVVTHGLVIQAVLQAHASLPTGTALPQRIGNTSLTIVSAQPPHTVTLLDSTSHLDAGAADRVGGLSGG